MKKKLLWITETAVMLALLIALQALTKPMGQLVTGSCVNAILAVSALIAGLGSGITVALVSPVLAFLLGIAPQIVTVPAIMIGNVLYVLVLHLLYKDKLLSRLLAWFGSALVKFAALYFLVARLLCGVLAQPLLQQGILKEPMLQMLPAMFSWMQLFTALIGGGAAILAVPVLKKIRSV